MMKLTAEAVDAILRKTLYPSEETAPAGIKGVEGIVHTFFFHPERLKEAKPEIDELLWELPDAFQSKTGGGWSFLQMLMDRHGTQWTGLHLTMEALACLGIGAGSAKWLMRKYANALPGGVPYFVVTEPRPPGPQIDTPDIPEVDEKFFEEATLQLPSSEPKA